MSNLLNILILYLIFINTFYLYSFYIVVAQHIDIYIIIYMINKEFSFHHLLLIFIIEQNRLLSKTNLIIIIFCNFITCYKITK